MKRNPLIKHHPELFKKYHRIFYSLEEHFGYNRSIIAISLFGFTILLVSASFVAIAMIEDSTSNLIYALLTTFSVIFLLPLTGCHVSKFSKKLTLEERKNIAKNVLKERDEIISKENIIENKISKPIIKNFEDKVNAKVSDLLSDNSELITESVRYFLSYNDDITQTTGTFLSDVERVCYDISKEERKFKKSLIENKEKEIGNKRMSDLLNEKTETV